MLQKISFKPSPTFIGSFAVLVWGIALPVARYIETQIGILAYVGSIFASTALLGFLNHIIRKRPPLARSIFKNPLFYARWLCFMGNMPCVLTAVMIVQKPHVPLVILLNYLWPTTIILFSILIAGVTVTRRIPFIIGLFLVIGALSIEILRPDMLTSDLFSNPRDRIGYLLAVTAGISWGLYSALTRRTGHNTGAGAVVPLFQLSLASALPVSFMPGLASWDNLTLGLAGILTAWCILQFFAFQTWDYGMRQGNIVMLSLCAELIPWLSLATSHILLGVDITGKTALSALLLVAGAMTTRYGTLPIKSRNIPSSLRDLVSPPTAED